MQYRYKKYSDTESAVAKSAMKLFLQEGYSNVTYDKIADDCNINKNKIAWHFHRKEEILSVFLPEWLDVRESLAVKMYEETKDAYLAYASEIAAFVCLCSGSEIIREIFTIAYRDLAVLALIKNWSANKNRILFSKLSPMMSESVIRNKENVACSIEYAALTFSEVPGISFERKISLLLDSLLELYSVDTKTRERIITEVLKSNYKETAEEMHRMINALI